MVILSILLCCISETDPFVEEFEKYMAIQDRLFESDFDKLLGKTEPIEDIDQKQA